MSPLALREARHYRFPFVAPRANFWNMRNEVNSNCSIIRPAESYKPKRDLEFPGLAFVLCLGCGGQPGADRSNRSNSALQLGALTP